MAMHYIELNNNLNRIERIILENIIQAGILGLNNNLNRIERF